MSVRRTADRHLTHLAEEAAAESRTAVERAVGAGADRANEVVQARLSRIVGVVEKATGGDMRRFAGVNESEILTYVPDRRSISGLAAMMFGFFLLTVLPSSWKLVSILFFFAGLAHFVVGYVLNAKIDVPEGYEGWSAVSASRCRSARRGEDATGTSGTRTSSRSWPRSGIRWWTRATPATPGTSRLFPCATRSPSG